MMISNGVFSGKVLYSHLQVLTEKQKRSLGPKPHESIDEKLRAMPLEEKKKTNYKSSRFVHRVFTGLCRVVVVLEYSHAARVIVSVWKL